MLYQAVVGVVRSVGDLNGVSSPAQPSKDARKAMHSARRAITFQPAAFSSGALLSIARILTLVPPALPEGPCDVLHGRGNKGGGASSTDPRSTDLFGSANNGAWVADDGHVLPGEAHSESPRPQSPRLCTYICTCCIYLHTVYIGRRYSNCLANNTDLCRLIHAMSSSTPSQFFPRVLVWIEKDILSRRRPIVTYCVTTNDPTAVGGEEVRAFDTDEPQRTVPHGTYLDATSPESIKWCAAMTQAQRSARSITSHFLTEMTKFTLTRKSTLIRKLNDLEAFLTGTEPDTLLIFPNKDIDLRNTEQRGIYPSNTAFMPWTTPVVFYTRSDSENGSKVRLTFAYGVMTVANPGDPETAPYESLAGDLLSLRSSDGDFAKSCPGGWAFAQRCAKSAANQLALSIAKSPRQSWTYAKENVLRDPQPSIRHKLRAEYREVDSDKLESYIKASKATALKDGSLVLNRE